MKVKNNSEACGRLSNETKSIFSSYSKIFDLCSHPKFEDEWEAIHSRWKKPCFDLTDVPTITV